MVQVDVFWSYGLASGLTLAASKHLKTVKSPWDNQYFVGILLWTAIFFAPSGMYLLWDFPGWETMFVASDHQSIPAWVVAAFGITNITQAIVGYYVTYRFIVTDRPGAAKAQAIWSHAAMFFILFVGWDGTGFSRFTHTGTSEEFHQGIHNPWYEWLLSPVAFTLIGMGVLLIPSYIYLCRKWMK